MSMRANDLARLLADNDIQGLCKDLLGNNWIKKGGEFCIGGINGESGDSMMVRLTGAKKGIWREFNGEFSGDLIGLIRTIKGISVYEACQYAENWLGIKSREEVKKISEKKKEYVRPEFKNNGIADICFKYLTEKRKLTLGTLNIFKISGTIEDGGKLYFPFYVGDECYLIKSVLLKRKPDGKKIIESSSKSEKCLFGWQSFDGSEREIIITEGEIDAMTWFQYGYKALSVPFGQGALDWIEDEYKRLSVYDTIYLALDNEPAALKSAKEIVQRLGKSRCRIITTKYKDINECLQNEVPKNEIDGWVLNAEGGSAYLKRAMDFYDEGYSYLFPEPEQFIGTQTPWAHINKTVLFRPGELSIWQGINGHGKTQLLGQIMLNFMMDGHPICIASLEMMPKKLLGRMAKQFAGKYPTPEDYAKFRDAVADKFYLFNYLGAAKLDDILEAFKEARQRYGVNIFLIDSFLMLSDVDEEDNKGHKRAMLKITNFKNNNNCHVHLIAHPRKQFDEMQPPNKMSTRGSSSIIDVTDNLFTLWRNKIKEEAKRKFANKELDENDEDYINAIKMPDAVFYYQKDREEGNDGGNNQFGLYFNRESCQYLEKEGDFPTRYIKDEIINPFEEKTKE